MPFSPARIWAIAKKEFFHLRRDHLTGGMVAGIPIVMSILFGYAINNDVRGLHAAAVDEANTSMSRLPLRRWTRQTRRCRDRS